MSFILANRLNACKVFSQALSFSVTQVHIDNTSVVAYLGKEGGTHFWQLAKMARQMLDWCDFHRVVLQPVHIAGYRNIHTGPHSRGGASISRRLDHVLVRVRQSLPEVGSSSVGPNGVCSDFADARV